MNTPKQKYSSSMSFLPSLPSSLFRASSRAELRTSSTGTTVTKEAAHDGIAVRTRETTPLSMINAVEEASRNSSDEQEPSSSSRALSSCYNDYIKVEDDKDDEDDAIRTTSARTHFLISQALELVDDSLLLFDCSYHNDDTQEIRFGVGMSRD